jgi:Type II secretion system (T2SS), protein N
VKRRGLLVAVFVLALLAGLAAQLPLSFAMKQAGLAQRGLAWQQARGTVWRGQVVGVSAAGRALGAVDMQFDAARWMSGGGGHALRWTSAFGHGFANADVGAGTAALKAVTAEIDVKALPGAPAQLSQFDGTLRVQNAAMDFRGAACTDARGTVTSDMARRAAARFGQDWPDLTGKLGCDKGILLMTLNGKAADGTAISVLARADTGVKITILNAAPDVQQALALSGFVVDGGALKFQTLTD